MKLRFEAAGHRLDAGLSDLRTDMADLRAELSDNLAHHTRTLSIAMVGQAAVVATVVFAAAASWG